MELKIVLHKKTTIEEQPKAENQINQENSNDQNNQNRMGFRTRQEARRFTHARSETEIIISYPCRISMMRELRVYTYWSKDRYNESEVV
jgi:hypothetical protein